MIGYELHRDTVDRYRGGEPCELETGADWPYHCEARDRYPDHEVTICRRHLVWWHEEKVTR
jgi:hypothetical protein